MTDFNDIRTVSQPVNIDVPLFKHQLTMVYKMEKLEREQLVEADNITKETRIGVNADPTGFGKTLSMVALVLRDKLKWDMDVPFVQETISTESAGIIKISKIKRYEKFPTTLILVSQSIISQWEDEFKHTNLSVFSVTSKKHIDSIEPEDYDVVIVTVVMYNKLIMTFSKYAWKRFIFDEPGHIRVPGMKEVQAGFYWFVTATPCSITTKHRNCRGSFMKEIIGNELCEFESQFVGMVLRNNPLFVKASFEMPPTTHHYHQCYQPVFNAINGMVTKTINTMVEAGDIHGAIIALGGDMTENIVDLVKKKKLEYKIHTESKIRIYTMRGDINGVKEWTERKNSIIIQIEELDKRFHNMLNGQCNICLELLKNPVLEPNCQNLFCGKCLLTWLKRKSQCPLCRCDIKASDLVYVSDGKDNCKKVTKISPPRQMTKLEKIVDLIKNKPDGSFLIFSSYNSTFPSICSALKENEISFVEIRGSYKTCKTNIQKFKHGYVNVVFLNSNFNGSGINLQETTDIILYHEMTTSTNNQILGRANRIGRTIPLEVHHLQVHI
jgi:SNF2 family DNA or RNA helicase